MAPTSSAVLFQAPVAVALIAMVLQLSAAAAEAAAPPQAPVGKPGCNTTCGNVTVPYPFGISPGCSWPGLELTCDRSQNTPRLLLGDGTLRVTDIFVGNATVRVMRTSPIINTTADKLPSGGQVVSFGDSFTKYGYHLSYANNLVVYGCNVVARARTLGNEPRESSAAAPASALYSITATVTPHIIVLIMLMKGIAKASRLLPDSHLQYQPAQRSGSAVDLQRESHTGDAYRRAGEHYFCVRRRERVGRKEQSVGGREFPIVLYWGITRELPHHRQHYNEDIWRMLCKSEHSHCFYPVERPGQGRFTCQNDDGYEDNPYLFFLRIALTCWAGAKI